jgi:hypothetical protein
METIKGENEWAYMEIRKHYFYVQYKPDTQLDAEAARQVLRDCIELAGDKIYPAMTNIIQMPPHDKSVRDVFANEGSSSTTANAILVSSTFSMIVANFFLSLNKPAIPTRIFTDESKAAKWLEMFPIKARPVLV